MCKHLGWEETLALIFACIKFSSIRFTRPTMGRFFYASYQNKTQENTQEKG